MLSCCITQMNNMLCYVTLCYIMLCYRLHDLIFTISTFISIYHFNHVNYQVHFDQYLQNISRHRFLSILVQCWLLVQGILKKID